MCLAYPMMIRSIDGAYAEVEAHGVRRQVGLALVPDAKVGDHVLIHAGYAISVIDEAEAEETRRLFQELWASREAAEPDGASERSTGAGGDR